MYREKMQNRVEEALLDVYESMYRIAETYIGNEEAALNIVRDSVYRAVRDTTQVKSERYIETWIYKIVMNVSTESLSKKQREISFEELFDVYEAGTKYRYLDIKRLLDTLSDRERAVVILHFFEDKRLEEIAVILNANMGTVKSLLCRSLEKLMAEMKESRQLQGDDWLEKMREQYDAVAIPADLKIRVDRSIKQAKADAVRQKNSVSHFHIFKRVLN